MGPHPSQPYNPDIANAFFWAGEIETWGRGIDRVVRACRGAGTPEPKIRLEPGGLWFEFGFSEDYLESVGVKRKSGEGETASVEPNDGGAAHAVPAAERILTLLRANPTLTHAALAEELNISPYSVRHHLDKLRDTGQIRRVGSRKTGVWEVVE